VTIKNNDVKNNTK